MFGDGEQTRDYVYVGDVVAAVLAAVGSGGVYNVGTGVETTVNELHRLCAEVAGSTQDAEPRRAPAPATRAAACSTPPAPSASSAGARRRRSTRACA